MAGRMLNPSISDSEKGFISILIDDTYPANKKGVIVKDSNKEKYFMKATGYDEIKGYLYFTVYEAGVLDTDGEFMKSEDLDFMHLDLMKNMKSTKLADINHDTKRLQDVFLMEIYKEVDEDGNTTALKGAYYIKENELLMQKAKDGKINGVSIMGRVEDIIDEPLSKWETMIKAIHDKLFGKEENKTEEHDMTKEEIQNMTDEQLAEMNLQRIGNTDDGNTDDNTTDDGSTDDGSTDDGSTDDGSTDEDQEKAIKAKDEEIETLKSELAEKAKQIEKLEADNKQLKKMKLVNKNEDAIVVKQTDEEPPKSFTQLINRIGAENE